MAVPEVSDLLGPSMRSRQGPGRSFASRPLRAALLVAAVTGGGARADAPVKAFTPVVQLVIPPEDGPRDEEITALAQTADGFLFVGTERALWRFDGVRFVEERWRRDDEEPREVKALAASRTGLWLSDGRLWRRDAGGWQEPAATKGRVADVRDVIEAEDGTVWLATGAGVVRLRGDELIRYGVAEGLPSADVRVVALGADGGALAGGDAGLARLTPGRARAEPLAAQLPLVWAIFEEAPGKILVGGVEGLVTVQGGRAHPRGLTTGGKPPMVRAIERARDGALWLATSEGVMRLRGDEVDPVGPAQGLPDRRVTTILTDAEGGVWVATEGAPLGRLTRRAATTFSADDGLAHDGATAVLETEAALWVGTRDGLSRWRAGRWQELRFDPFDSRVHALAARRAGGVWVGAGPGLFWAGEGAQAPVAASPELGLPAGGVTAVHEDGAGVLWVNVERRGVYRIEAGRAAPFVAEALPAGTAAAFFAADRRGRLWLGTADRGLVRIEGGRAVRLSTADGLPDDRVRSFLEDEAGEIWVGTMGRGLARLRGGRFVVYAIDAPDLEAGPTSIVGLLEDGQRRLWLGTQRGVLLVERAAIADVDAGRAAALVPRAFGTADGMKSRRCEGGTWPTATRGRDGRLWFATRRGVVAFDAARAALAPPLPPVAVESLELDGRSVLASTSRTFPPGPGRLEARFTVPFFAAPERVRFRYRLVGFDDGWIDAGHRRTAHYTNLPAGSYALAVEAALGPGAWASSGPGAGFVLRPRATETWWFRAGLGLVALGLVLLLQALRARRLRAGFAAVLAERGRLAREIHDSLAQSLSAVWLRLEGLRGLPGEVPPAVAAQLEQIRALTRHSLEEARAFVRELRAEGAAGSDLFADLRASAERLAAGTETRVDVRVRSEAAAPTALPPAVARELLRIGQEAVANAVKHARARNVAVEIALGAAEVRLRVVDDGVGFEPGEPPPDGRFGLVGMMERTEALQGRFVIRSRPGQGCEVQAVVPLREAKEGGKEVP